MLRSKKQNAWGCLLRFRVRASCNNVTTLERLFPFGWKTRMVRMTARGSLIDTATVFLPTVVDGETGVAGLGVVGETVGAGAASP